MQPRHLEVPKRKKNLIYITKFLVKATMLFTYKDVFSAKYRMSKIQKPFFI